MKDLIRKMNVILILLLVLVPSCKNRQKGKV